MTTHDPDAWWSPVPGRAPEPAREGAADLGAPQPAGPGATWEPRPGGSASPRPRRAWPRRLLVVGAVLLVLVVAAVLTVRAVVSATKVLYDAPRTLSVSVPRSWFDNTGAPGVDPDAPPVLAASNLWQSQRIEVDRFEVEAGDTLAAFHAEGVDDECARWTCTTRTAPQQLSVAGHEALEQVVTHPAEPGSGASSSLTLTVWLDDGAVEVYGLATSSGPTAPDASNLRRVAASLQLL